MNSKGERMDPRLFRTYGRNTGDLKTEEDRIRAHRVQSDSLWKFVESAQCSVCRSPLGRERADQIFQSKMALLPGTLLSGYPLDCPDCGMTFTIDETRRVEE